MGVDVAEAVAGDGFLHRALLYRGAAEFRAAIDRYVRGGLARAEPVLIATPPGKVSWLRRDLSGGVPGLAFTDMTELGRNPARIIPAIRAFMDRNPGRRIRYLSEPVWPDRSAAELREAVRYEALVNTAFSGTPATMVCLYDRAGLTSSVLDDAGSTHPALLCHGEEQASSGYLGPDGLPPGCDRPLAGPPATAERLELPARPAAGAQPWWPGARAAPGCPPGASPTWCWRPARSRRTRCGTRRRAGPCTCGMTRTRSCA